VNCEGRVYFRAFGAFRGACKKDNHGIHGKKLKGNSVVPVRKTTTEYTEASVFLSEHSVVLARKITTEYTEKH
jgi:hypothetical protein